HPQEAVAIGATPEPSSDSVGATAQPSNAEPEEAPAPPPTAAAADEEKPSAQDAPVAVASADDEKEEIAATKPKRQPHMPRTAAEDKKSGAPEEKAKPKKEEKSEPQSSDDVMLAERAKPRPAAAAAAVAAENAKQGKSSNGAATDIDQLLATKPAKQPAKSRSIDDLLEGADSKGGPAKGAVAAATAPAPAATPAANPAASGADDSDLPDSPSRDEILAAMRGVESQVRGCAEGQQLQGTAEVALSIAGNTGRITNATVNGITGNVGSCIARAVRNAKFSRFKKSNFSIKYPYRF
ncbi:MAG TPA: hypothetical protein VHZ95_07370, partial [Polyangiales bacterium]|nr:hypothetical protein [Polyangiales bacterium]